MIPPEVAPTEQTPEKTEVLHFGNSIDVLIPAYMRNKPETDELVEMFGHAMENSESRVEDSLFKGWRASEYPDVFFSAGEPPRYVAKVRPFEYLASARRGPFYSGVLESVDKERLTVEDAGRIVWRLARKLHSLPDEVLPRMWEIAQEGTYLSAISDAKLRKGWDVADPTTDWQTAVGISPFFSPSESLKFFAESWKISRSLRNILQEFNLAPKIARVVASPRAQEIVQSFGYSSFIYPLPKLGIIDRKNNRKIKIRSFIPGYPIDTDSVAYDVDILGDQLIDLFHSAGIEPGDFGFWQMLVSPDKDKPELYLLDAEGFVPRVTEVGPLPGPPPSRLYEV